jgi:RNA polymerase sigma-70 factor (ECF subfamily)
MSLAIYPLAGPCQDAALPPRRRLAVPAPKKGSYRMTEKSEAPATPADIGAQIVAIATADMAAFEALFRDFGPRIRAYLLKLTRDSQAAEDLMQETMLAIWRKAGQFDPARGQASAWIFTIARNIWIDAWRKQKRPAFDPDDPALVPAAEPEAGDILELRQSGAALHRALKTLPQEQVDLIRLSFFDEASHSTIAAQTGLPIGTVKSRIRLAFGRLRAALEELK